MRIDNSAWHCRNCTHQTPRFSFFCFASAQRVQPAPTRLAPPRLQGLTVRLDGRTRSENRPRKRYGVRCRAKCRKKDPCFHLLSRAHAYSANESRRMQLLPAFAVTYPGCTATLLLCFDEETAENRPKSNRFFCDSLPAPSSRRTALESGHV